MDPNDNGEELSSSDTPAFVHGWEGLVPNTARTFIATPYVHKCRRRDSLINMVYPKDLTVPIHFQHHGSQTSFVHPNESYNLLIDVGSTVQCDYLVTPAYNWLVIDTDMTVEDAQIVLEQLEDQLRVSKQTITRVLATLSSLESPLNRAIVLPLNTSNEAQFNSLTKDIMSRQ